LLWLAVVPVLGCVSPGGRADFLPFYRSRDTTGRKEVLIPPLLSSFTEKKASGRKDYRFLWPVGHYRTEGRESKFLLYPLFYNIKRVDHNGFIDHDYALFPLLFGGHSVDEGGYFTLLPFGGTLKGIGGKDEIVGVLPPLYIYMRDKEFHSYHYLFPFINRVEGGGRKGWRIFPFYGHYERWDEQGRQAYDRTFVLWPLLTLHRNNMNSAHPVDVFFFLPFYGRVKSDNVDRYTVLWPLFKYVDLKKEGFWELRAPFPVVIFARGKDRSRSDIWPLIGFKERPGFKRHFVLWPIERYEAQDNEEYRDEKLWILPIYWHYYRRWKEDGSYRKEVKIWPLFRYRRSRDGETAVSLLAPFWFKDPEAFEKIWEPLFRVYHNYREEDGTEVTTYLWGLIQYSRKGARKGLRLFYLPEIPFGGGEAGAKGAGTPAMKEKPTPAAVEKEVPVAEEKGSTSEKEKGDPSGVKEKDAAGGKEKVPVRKRRVSRVGRLLTKAMA
jgi:hypothetical protein